MKIQTALAALATLVLATPVMAQSDAGMRITAGVTGGTLGIGPEVGLRFSDHFGVRGNATFLGIGADFDSDDITYKGDLKLKSFGAMLDAYPFGGSFRVSGGARINRNYAGVRASTTGSVEVGGDTYTSAQVGVLTGRADVKDLAPALTLGWGGSNRKGFIFGTELGVLFQGKARLRQFTSNGTLSNNAAFNASLERERRDLQDDIDKVSVYPIAQIMIGWRF